MGACEHYEELISALIDGVLDPADRPALMEHMADCPACQAYFDDQIAMHDAMDRGQVQAPEGFAEAVLEQARRTPQDRAASRVIPLRRWRRWGALAACCALAALGVWGMQGQKQSADQALPSGAARGYVYAEGAESVEEPPPAEAPQDGSAYVEGAVCADDAGVEPAAAPPLSAASPEEEKQDSIFSERRPGENFYYDNGWIRAADGWEEAVDSLLADAGSVVYDGKTFFLREDCPEGYTTVYYFPDGESGRSYTACFDAEMEQEAIFELLLSLEISE